MIRYDALEILAEKEGDKDTLIIANIGFPSKELYKICDRKANFYMLGSMGLSSSIGLGLALARPDRKVLAIDGDGSVLMNMGSLATIANQHPDNYLLVIIDNGAYGSTGNQITATAGLTDLKEIALGAGVQNVAMVSDESDLKEKLDIMGNGVLIVKTEPGNKKVPVIHLCPADIIKRFMEISSPPSHSR